MQLLSNETVLRQLQWRYAVKKFDPTKKIPAETWSTLAQSLVLTPSSYGLQPWRFYVVTDPDTKAQLPAISWGQKQVQDASHVVVMAVRANFSEEDVDRFIDRVSEVRGGTRESLAGFRKMLISNLCAAVPGFDVSHWATNQVYIALGQLMACAAFMGIDACPMEGILREKYDELLGIPSEGYVTSVVCALGYRAEDDKYASVPKVRFPLDQVVIDRKATSAP
jgi:nitroreductase